MANWVVAFDADDDRRSTFLAGLKATISPIDGLEIQSTGGRGWSAIWAAASNAPTDVCELQAGGAVVWGEPRNESGKLQSARDIHAAWLNGKTEQWDGFYSAVAVDESRQSLAVGADLLGIFPVYFWSNDNGVILVGSSPDLFTGHPKFATSLDKYGLVGILLTNGLVADRTLWSGVRRLRAGYQLSSNGNKLREELAYDIPEFAADTELPLDGHVDQLADGLADAVKRHAPPDQSYGMLLSGGLDSRMIAGFLKRAGVEPNALTLGLPSDLEMRCAVAVADQYGLNHIVGEPVARDYPALSRVSARWEHLACGFTTIRDWWTQSKVAELGDRLVTGGLADSLVGGVSLEWAYSDKTQQMSYETYAANMPNLGIKSEVMRELLAGTGYAELVDEVEEDLRQEFHSYGDRVSHCAWRFDLAHGQRFHVGGTAWRMAFGAWPILPMLDRRIVEIIAKMPAASLSGRALQIAMVKKHLPELRTIPLDRSDLLSEEPQYLQPEGKQVLAAAARRKLRFLHKVTRKLSSSEKRYWNRINDFNGEYWRVARREAEPMRERVANIFDPDFLSVVLPHADSKYIDGPFVSESGRKLLLGFLFWAEHNLAA